MKSRNCDITKDKERQSSKFEYLVNWLSEPNQNTFIQALSPNTLSP